MTAVGGNMRKLLAAVRAAFASPEPERSASDMTNDELRGKYYADGGACGAEAVRAGGGR